MQAEEEKKYTILCKGYERQPHYVQRAMALEDIGGWYCGRCRDHKLIDLCIERRMKERGINPRSGE